MSGCCHDGCENGCCSGDNTTQDSDSLKNYNIKTVLQLKDSTESDLDNIKNILSNMNGIAEVLVNTEKREIEVHYDDIVVSVEMLVEFLSEKGYQVKVIK